jgi:N-hydroxyarylamine O-acetyltransferase
MGTEAKLDRGLCPSEITDYLRLLKLEPSTCQATPGTQQSLSTLIEAHQRVVPFENLEALEYKRVPSLNVDDLYAKIVQERHGGWCYELNGLFAALLRGLGYEVTAHICDVCRDDQVMTGPPRHRINLVHLPGGTYFCDVGFGGVSPGFAPQLIDHELQEGRGGVFLFRPFGAGSELLCQSEQGLETPLLAIGLKSLESTAFLPYNEYGALDPGSPFTRQPIVRRPPWAEEN